MQTRGFRNNNPGNLRASASFTWQGQTGVDPQGFVIFNSMQNGVRALAITLKNYSAIHGLDTISGIIRRYAPDSENNTAAYISDVSSYMGISPDQPIDVSAHLPRLIGAIVRHENGTLGPVNNGVINSGVQSA